MNHFQLPVIVLIAMTLLVAQGCSRKVQKTDEGSPGPHQVEVTLDDTERGKTTVSGLAARTEIDGLTIKTSDRLEFRLIKFRRFESYVP